MARLLSAVSAITHAPRTVVVSVGGAYSFIYEKIGYFEFLICSDLMIK